MSEEDKLNFAICCFLLRESLAMGPLLNVSDRVIIAVLMDIVLDISLKQEDSAAALTDIEKCVQKKINEIRESHG